MLKLRSKIKPRYVLGLVLQYFKCKQSHFKIGNIWSLQQALTKVPTNVQHFADLGVYKQLKKKTHLTKDGLFPHLPGHAEADSRKVNIIVIATIVIAIIVIAIIVLAIIVIAIIVIAIIVIAIIVIAIIVIAIIVIAIIIIATFIFIIAGLQNTNE